MKTIVTAVDFSDVTDAVMSNAATMAKALGAQVYVLHVAVPEPSFVTYAPGPQGERDFRAKELRKEHRDVQALADQLTADGIKTEALLVPGEPIAKIVEEAQELRADLIILGSHGHGALYDLLVGSVADGVMRKSDCPVLVVPARK